MRIIILVIIWLCFTDLEVSGQGPQVSYFYNPVITLTWAQAYAYQLGGSALKINFLPVIMGDHSPAGTFFYSHDIDIDAPVVFVGNGIIKKGAYDSYAGRRLDYTKGELDLRGKAVLIFYDFEDSVEATYGKDFSLETRISEATKRGASLVIFYSHQKEFPFLLIPKLKNEIPVITIDKRSLDAVFSGAGIETNLFLNEWQTRKAPPESSELTVRIKIVLSGAFQKIKTDHFTIYFRNEELEKSVMNDLAQVNEKSYNFISQLFNTVELNSVIPGIVYFKDYDSKVFYTHHWGKGLATNDQIFNVYSGTMPNFELAVHENTHLFWGSSTSFLSEGIATYAEAQAGDKNKNHRATLAFLKSRKLFPLHEMVAFQIGATGMQTEVGYPAAGSFVGYLLDRFGIAKFKEIYMLEDVDEDPKKNVDPWQKVFGRSLTQLEREWHEWLTKLVK